MGVGAVVEAGGDGDGGFEEAAERGGPPVGPGVDAHDRPRAADDEAAQGVVPQDPPGGGVNGARGAGAVDVGHQRRVGGDAAPLDPQVL